LILDWVDQYRARTGRLPTSASGKVHGVPGEAWSAIDLALRQGHRGLQGNSSLAKLLYNKRGVRSANNIPRLTERIIIQWAKVHHRRTGAWPTRNSGPILDAPTETWHRVNTSLIQGDRSLQGGSSLAQLLDKAFGVRNPKALPTWQVRISRR
jgi:hypothetical protein